MSSLTVPTLISATPSLNTSAVSADADIVLTFSAEMAAGTGLITISDGATQTYMGKDGALHTRLVGATDTRTVSITDTSQVTVSGNTVTINLASNLQSGKSYSVQMGKGVLLDTAGNAYAGLSDTAKLHFTTSSVAIPSATVDSNFSMTDTGSSATDFITSSAAQTVSGKYTGTLATGDFVEVSLDNGAHWITATTSAASNTWSATGAIAASSTILARVSNAANVHSTAAHHVFTYDADAPTAASFTMSDKVLVAGETSTVTIAFNEAVTGLELSDFTVTGGKLSNLASADSGKTWTATLTPTANVANGAGQITLASGGVSDVAGNGGPVNESSQTFSYSTVPATPTATVATISMTDTGVSTSDFITNSTAQTISGTYTGTLATGEYIEVSLDDGATWSKATTGESGWTLTGQTISASSTLQARVTNGDTFGNALTQSYTLDQAAPTATVTLSDNNLRKGETATITVTFDEAVTGLTSDSFKSNDTISTPVSTDGGITWTATLTPTNNGENTVILYASSVTDKAGNSGPAEAVPSTYLYDATPTVTIASVSMTDTGSSSSDFITNSSAQSLSGTISAALSGTEKVQVSLDNGSTWTDAATNGTSWSLTGQTITSSNTLKVRVSDGATHGTEYSHAYTLDQAAPTATVSLDDATLTSGQTGTVTVTFNEAVTGLTSNDFTVTNGTLGTPSSSDGGTTWTATLTPSANGSGSVQLNMSTVTDTAGNSGPSSSSSASFAYDSTPTATVSSAQMTDTGISSTDFITNSTSQTISGKYSGTLATGDKVQVSLDDGTTWTNATASSGSWSLSGQTISASNTLQVRVANGTTHSEAYSHAYTLDQTAPTATVAVANAALTTGETTTVTVTFSEAVSGLTSSDFTVSGGSIGTPSSSDGGATWTATLTPSANGSGSVQLNTSTATDTAGNSGPSSSASTEFSYDTTPTVTIATASISNDTGSSSSDFITNTASQTISGTLSVALLTGEKVQVSLDNGSTWTEAATSGASWTLSGQTLSASSTLQARVAYGTTYGTVYSHSYTLDQAAPTATVSLDDATLTSGQTGTVTVTFNEAVTGLTSSDFTVTNGTLGTPSSSDGGTTWTATLTPSANGSGSVQLNMSTVTDTAGNSGPSSSSSASFAYDSTPTATISSAQMTDTGISSTDFITNSTSQTISGKYSGTLATGDKVQVSLDDGTTWTNATASSGSWSLSGQTISASNTLQVRVANGTTHSEAYSHVYTLDQTAPTATVSVANASLTTGDTTTVTVAFSEAVSGLTSSDFTVSGGSIGTPSSSDGGSTWTATLTPSTKGSGSVQLNTSTVTDTAGNSGPSSSSSASFTYTPTPTVTISSASMTDTGASSSDFITNSTSQSLSGTLSASLASGEKVQVSLNNGSSWTDATTDGASWSLTGQTISASDTLQVRVANGSYYGTVYSHAYTLDQTAPTASIELTDASLTTGETTTVTVTFSEAISSLASSNFTVTGGTIGAPSTSDGGTTWTATLTPSTHGSGSVQLNAAAVSDTAGNTGPASAPVTEFYYDTTPTATISSAAFSSDTGDSSSDFITNNSTQTITGTLSAALATGDYVQVSLDNGSTWNEATTDGTSWSLARQTLNASNTMQVRVTNGTVSGSSYSQAYTLDQSAPTVSSFSLDDTTLGGSQTGALTVVFTEKVVGLTSSDFTVSGGALGTMSSTDGITWTGTLTPTASGSITFSVNSVTDVAGNSGPATAPSSLSYSYDNTAPTATLALNDTKLTTGETATLTVTLSEAVTDTPTASDFTVSGGSLGTFTSVDGGTTWTATLTPTSSAAGAGTVTLSAGSISDPYGNAGPASAVQLSFDYDTQTPALTSDTVALSSDTGAYSNDFITQTSSQTVTGSFTGTVYSATGAKIEVSANNGETWTTATVNNTTHTWSASETLSGSGILKVRLTDSTGTTSTESHTYKVDTTAPGSLASITPELSSDSDTGNGGTGTSYDNITDSSTPTVKVYVANLSSSSFPVGDFIDILDTSNGNALVGTHTIASSEIGSYGGYVEVELSSSLSEGSHTLVARARDLAGNTGTQSSEALAITVDKTVASMASHTVDLAAASDLGESSTDNITKDSTPTVTVNVANTANLSAGDILQIYDTTNSVVVGSHTLTDTDFSSSGADISITLTADNNSEGGLADGVHALALRVYDKAGNIGTQSTTTTSVTIDTVAPTLSSTSPVDEAPNVSVSSGITLTFSEAMDVHSDVSFDLSHDDSENDIRSFGFEALAGDVSSYNENTHTITLTPGSNLLTSSSYTLTFGGGTLTDLAGNIFQESGTRVISFSSESGSITISTPDPVTLALTETTYASHTGTDTDGYTSNNTLEVTGITESHLKYSLDAGSSWTTVDVSGTSASITLPDGTYESDSIQVKQYSSTDYVSSAAQTSQSWTIDTTAPTAYIATSELPEFQGGSASSLSGFIGGTLITDTDSVEYTIDGGSTWTLASSTTASEWSIDSVTVTSGGEIGLRVTDVAGNLSTHDSISGYTVYVGGSEAGTHSATGDKILYTEGGADTINITNSGNVVDAGTGNDAINVNGDSNTVYGNTGSDTINVNGTGNTIDAGYDDDTIVISYTDNTIDGGDGTDTIEFNTSASLSSLVDKVTNIEKLYVSGTNTLTIANGMTKADLTAMGFSTATALSSTYAVVKVDGDSTGHLSLGTSFTYKSAVSDLVMSLGSSLTSGYYTYVDTADSVIVLVGTSFLAQ